MARQINPHSLYPIIGMIFSYIRLSPYDSVPFVKKLLLTSKELIESASQREKLWYDLTVSFFFKEEARLFLMKQQYLKANKSLSKAYLDLFNFDPNDIETLTLATYLAESGYSVEARFLRALEIHPHHIGANHYLVHLKESTGKSSEALEYAQTLFENASYNGHAVHMLAHILPELGLWSEAKTLFQKAHEIHLAWSQKNEVSAGEDWHYSHNLHLLSIAHISLGELKEAYQVLKNLCYFSDYDPACFHLYSLYSVMEDLDSTHSHYDHIITKDPFWRPHLQKFIDEIALLKGASFKSLSLRSKHSIHLILVNRIIQSQKTEDPLSKQQLIDDIGEYIEINFPQTNFDSLSNGLIISLRILSATARVRDIELYHATLAAIKKKASEFEFDLYK